MDSFILIGGLSRQRFKILADRSRHFFKVHHEGRLGKTALSAATRNIRNTLLPGDIHTNTRHCLVLGDFARTGLLYVFEATGRSSGLEEWVVSSDLP